MAKVEDYMTPVIKIDCEFYIAFTTSSETNQHKLLSQDSILQKLQ